MNRTPLENEIQYKTTCYWVDRFAANILVLKDESDNNMNPLIKQAALDAMISIRDDLVWEKQDYERRVLNKK